MMQRKIKTHVKSKLLGLHTSNMAYNGPQGFLFMIEAVPQNFSPIIWGCSALKFWLCSKMDRQNDAEKN